MVREEEDMILQDVSKGSYLKNRGYTQIRLGMDGIPDQNSFSVDLSERHPSILG